MPEARDRLRRPDVTASMFVNRRSPGSGILLEEPERRLNLLGSPFQWGTASMTAARGLTPGPVSVAASRASNMGRASFGTPRSGNGRGRIVFGSPSVGRDNRTAGTGRRGRGRAVNSPLPSWYPRMPLRDITGILRAIERRRSRLGEAEGHLLESPMPQDQSARDPPLLPISIAPLEHDVSMLSPNPSSISKPYPPHIGNMPKTLLAINNQIAGESDFLTPQKKLLNSIDLVEKVMMEEFRKMKRTPSAKKAERERKVRTLMSLR